MAGQDALADGQVAGPRGWQDGRTDERTAGRSVGCYDLYHMAYIVMAYIVMAYIVMAYMVMAGRSVGCSVGRSFGRTHARAACTHLTS